MRSSPPTGTAARVTFSTDVAPILYKNCVGCHRPGEIRADVAQDLRRGTSWVRAIRRAVSERTMPPWGADPQFSEFVNDARLGGKDVATLDNWQPSYIFKQAIAAPKGSRIETVAHYDNSAANKPNPDPAARVTFGPEILNGSIDYTVDSQDLRRLTTAAEAGR